MKHIGIAHYFQESSESELIVFEIVVCLFRQHYFLLNLLFGPPVVVAHVFRTYIIMALAK